VYIIRSNFIGNGGVKFYNNTEKHMYKFNINGKQYEATWNNHRAVVDVQNYGLGLEFTVFQDDNGFTTVEPCFNWQETTDQRKAVANFLEGTNVVEVCQFIYMHNPSRRANRMIVRKAKRFDEIKESSEVA